MKVFLQFVQATLFCAGAAILSAPASARAPAPPRDNAIPSCYENLREYAPQAAFGDLTVVIDQTAFLDVRMRQIVRETVERLIRPGVNVSVATFSGYLQGRYLDVQVSGQVEAPVDAAQRDFVSKRDLRQNDECLRDQLVFARRLIGKSLDTAFAGIDPSVERSDILSALRDLGRRVHSSQAQARIVVVVSDMLENSSIASFYQASRLRVIDPETEMRHAMTAGIKADFHEARVVVIGAGGISSAASGEQSYRDPRAMLALEDFWRRWFSLGHADLVEFGKPTPLVKINWDRAELLEAQVQ